MAPLVHMVTTPAFTRLDKNVSLRSYVSTIYRSAPRKKSYRQPCYAVGIGVKTNRALNGVPTSACHHCKRVYSQRTVPRHRQHAGGCDHGRSRRETRTFKFDFIALLGTSLRINY